MGKPKTILSTFPSVFEGLPCENLRKYLTAAVTLHLQYDEGKVDGVPIAWANTSHLDVRDAQYNRPNTGLYEIFNAWKHDPAFDATPRPRDVVTDGNYVLCRNVEADEKGLRGTRKELARRNLEMRRPAASHPHQAAAQKRPASAASCMKRPATSAPPKKGLSGRGRCSACAGDTVVENRDPKRTKLAGVFATVDMRTGEVLQLCEMLNAECKPYKEQCLADIAARTPIRVYCHDCACNMKGQRVMLDGWHAKHHKCDPEVFDPCHELNEGFMSG